MNLSKLSFPDSCRPLLVIIIFISFVAIYYWPTIISLWNLWYTSQNATYSHGLLLVAVAVYGFYSRYNQCKFALSIQINLIFLVILVCMSFLWGGMFLAGIAIGHQFFLFSLIIAGLLYIFPFRPAIYLAMPIALIIFAIPVWEVINQGDMQYIMAVVVTFLLDNTGILTYREGFDIHIPAGTFTVAGNCSGMRQLVVSLPMAIIFSSIQQLKFRYSLLLVLMSALVAVVSNIIRIYIIVVSGQLTNMQHYFVTEDHVMLGWVVFAILFFLFVYFSRYYIEKYRLSTTADEKIYLCCLAEDTSFKKQSIAVLLLVSASSIGPLYAQYNLAKDYVYPPANNDISVDNWNITDGTNLDYSPDFLKPNWSYARSYQYKKDFVMFYINYYAVQKQDNEAVSELNRIYDGVRWNLVKHSKKTLRLEGVSKFPVEEFIVQDTSGRILRVWRWYYTNGAFVANESSAKLLNLYGAFTNDTSAALLVLVSRIDETDISDTAAKQFIVDSRDSVQAMLDKLR